MRRMTVRRPVRSGATLVETALVLSLLLLFLFGIFEYSRYLLVNQLLANAARDGARYASCNVDKQSNFVTVDDPTGVTNITSYVRQECKGADKWVSNFAVSVFPCDNSATTGSYADPPVIKPKASYNSWNEATFTDRIAVQITCKYQPVLPVVWLPQAGQSGFVVGFYGGSNSVDLTITAATGSEG